MHWATPVSTTSLRQAVARHPAVVEVARAAAEITSDLCQIVTFEDSRAYVVAASGGEVLQPRPLLPEERHLIDNEGAAPADPSSQVSVFPIVGARGEVVGSLTVHGRVDDSLRPGLAAMARVVSGVIAVDSETDDDGSNKPVAAEIANHLRDAIIVLDEDLTIRWANDAVGSLLSRSRVEVIGKSAADFVHPGDLGHALDAISRLSSGLQVYRILLRLQQADGGWGRVEVTGTDQTENPLIGGLVLSIRNDDLDLEMEADQVRAQHMSGALVEQMHDGIVATDAVGAITLVNRAAYELFGLDPETPPSRLTWRDLPLLDRRGNVVAENHHPVSVLTGGQFAGVEEMSVASRRGGHHYVTVQQRSVTAEDGSLLGSVISFHDVTETRRAQGELVTQALHDQLTGLANRRMLAERISELALEAASQPPTAGVTRTTRLVAACFLDLDNFKLVNDTHGHRTGDQMIRIAAERLGAQLRDGDLLVRQGGDEFVALLVDVESDEMAMKTGERLRAALSEPFLIDGTRFDLTASAGVTVMPIEALDEDEILRQADIALYAAKALGRNRSELFDDALAFATEIEERQRRTLRNALDNDGIVMHFQPLVDSRTGKTSGFEALARCIDADGTLLMPSAFLDSVAGSGLVWDLDRRAFELSCSAAAVLSSLIPDEPPIIACNFSPVSIVQPDFVEFILATTLAAEIEPSQMCVEITESAAFAGGDTSLQAVIALHEAGFLVALDDFGTGYSSLSHLRDLPLSSVKVDRSFVMKLSEDSSERAIAEAVVGLASDLGLGIVAEGVETEAQLNAARDLGFEVMQGWHYAQAMALDEVIDRWLDGSVGDGPDAGLEKWQAKTTD